MWTEINIFFPLKANRTSEGAEGSMKTGLGGGKVQKYWTSFMDEPKTNKQTNTNVCEY